MPVGSTVGKEKLFLQGKKISILTQILKFLYEEVFDFNKRRQRQISQEDGEEEE